eukprot:17847_1
MYIRYIRIYICMYIYIHTYIHIHMYMHIHLGCRGVGAVPFIHPLPEGLRLPHRKRAKAACCGVSVHESPSGVCVDCPLCGEPSLPLRLLAERPRCSTVALALAPRRSSATCENQSSSLDFRDLTVFAVLSKLLPALVD